MMIFSVSSKIGLVFIFFIIFVSKIYGSSHHGKEPVFSYQSPIVKSGYEDEPLKLKIDLALSMRGDEKNINSRIQLLKEIINSGKIRSPGFLDKIRLELDYCLTIVLLLNGKNRFRELKYLSQNLFSMRNTIIFSKRFNKRVGMHELEFLDPFHRKHAESWLLWCKDYNTDRKSDSILFGKYFLWLEQNLEVANDYTFYLSTNEREKFRLKISETGLLLRASDSVLYTSEPRELFVIDEKGNIFSGRNESDSFHHSSLSLGLPVRGSGIWKVNEGKISELIFESGHYLPVPEEAIMTVEYLQSGAVIFEKNWLISYFFNGEKITEDGSSIMRH